MWNMYTIILFICWVILFSDNLIVNANDIENALLWTGNSNIVDIGTNDKGITDVIRYVKSIFIGLLPIAVIATFIFIWARLFIARGNPEEFKAAMLHFVYVVIGIFIVSAAWAIVKLVSGINI